MIDSTNLIFYFILQKISKIIKDLTLKDHMKFMDNFDPELSNREKRKLSRKIYAEQG